MSRIEKQRRRQRRKERKFQQELRRGRRLWGRFSEFDGADGDVRSDIALLSYDITYDSIPGARSVLDDALSADEVERLHAQTMEDPATALPRLHELLERFPNAPILLNWLGRCHGFLGHDQEMERLARLNYARNPDYLFAKVNMAQFALRNGELDQIPVIFDNKLDLKLLYPERDVFHVSEYLAFASIMVEYYMRIGEHESAEIIFDTIEQIEPDHEITVRLRELLESSILLRVFRNLLGLTRRKGLRRSGVTSARSKPLPPPADNRPAPG